MYSLTAYHGNAAIKRSRLAQVKAHRAADEIQHGFYWENGRGCAVGCTIHSADHGAYETELGIPRILARLEDQLFESMPKIDARTWPERFLSAIKVGADLSRVWPQFAIWLLVSDEYGVLRHARSEASTEAILRVADFYTAQLEGIEVDPADWQQARNAAADAADAAYAAAYAAAAAAAAAADAAADAAAAAAAAAYAAAAADAADAYDAAYAAAERNWSTGREQWSLNASKHLIQLLREASAPIM
jgi:hypothetical protein